MDRFEIPFFQFKGIPDYLDYLAVRHLVKYAIAYVRVEYLRGGRNLGRLLSLLSGFMASRRFVLGCLLVQGVWPQYRRMFLICFVLELL